MGGTRRRLTKTEVERARPGWLWDSEAPGLGVRVLPSGVRSYVFRYGTGRKGQGRRITLGQHGEITVEQARDLARALIGAVAGGRDPALERRRARGVPTLREFADEYLTQHSDRHKRPGSAAVDRELLRLYLLPAFGTRPLDQITRQDVAQWHRRQHGKPFRANRCLALLSSIYSKAHAWGVLEVALNPAKGVTRYAEPPRQRYLTPVELLRLGAVLAPLESYPAVAIKLLMMTGARRSEVLGLRWEDVDLDRGAARLRERKAGPPILLLPAAAVTILRRLERLEKNPYVLPSSRRRGQHLDGNSLTHAWANLRVHAGLRDVRLHDLRHTFASILAARGVSLPIIGGLLGHSSPQMTARYAHLAHEPLMLAADGAADVVQAALEPKS